MKTEEFNKAFFEKWDESGGLIPQTTAAHIIGVSPEYIMKLTRTQKLKSYIFEKSKFVSLNEIMKLKITREAKNSLSKK